MGNAITIPIYGATIEWSDDGSSWTNIPKADSVRIPNVSQEYRDVTNLDSPDGFREWQKGLKDGGEFSLECLYSKELWKAAAAKAALVTAPYFRVTLVPDTDQSAGDKFQWQAHVNPSIPDGEIDGDMKISLDLRVTGGVSWTEGAAA